MITTSIMPALITQAYDRKLLSVYDRWEMTKESIAKWTENAKRKYMPNSRRMKEFEKHVEIFEKLYEWTKAEEAYLNAEDKQAAQRPIIPAEAIYSLCGKLGKDIRGAFWDASLIKSTKYWKNGQIHKV